MKSIFAYNFNQPKMQNPVTETPTFGGPNSAFSPYKVHTETAVPPTRKDAFRRLKRLFGLTEPVGVDNSYKLTSASNK